MWACSLLIKTSTIEHTYIKTKSKPNTRLCDCATQTTHLVAMLGYIVHVLVKLDIFSRVKSACVIKAKRAACARLM